ncbi:MAG: hypothetical protein ACRDWH_10935, partial [Acidimicrobiia bacterium]
ISALPSGTVIVDDQAQARLVHGNQLFSFAFDRWTASRDPSRPRAGRRANTSHLGLGPGQRLPTRTSSIGDRGTSHKSVG